MDIQNKNLTNFHNISQQKSSTTEPDAASETTAYLPQAHVAKPLDTAILDALWAQQFGDFDASDMDYIFDPELAAVYLAATPANYQQLLALPSYPARDLYSLQKAQFSALASLAEGLLEPEQLGFYLRELAAIGAPDIAASLASFAERTRASCTATSSKPRALELSASLAERAAALLDPPLAASLAARCEQITAGAYAMGFCGCFNAGKSSLINALLSTDLLAASSAPETAAISILRHGKPGARIDFYTAEEFERIAQQAALSPEAAALFSAGYPEGLEPQHIELCELSAHTSAASAHSHLIREITIHLPSPLLASGARLVDTPGLDDIIISREQTSRRYLRECDEIFYLMSATQALSSKDCDFLREFATENPHTRITLLLSKADLLADAELPALCAYIKEKFRSLCGASNPQIFALSAASGVGLDVFKNYLLAQIASKDARSAQILAAAVASSLREQLGICEARRAQNEQQRIASESERAAANAQISRENDALSAAAQGFAALSEELAAADFEDFSARFLLAKRLAERIAAEFNYDAKFSEQNAANIVQQGFADYCAELEAASSRKLARFFERGATLLGELAKKTSGQNHAQSAALQGFEQLLSAQSPVGNIVKFLDFKNRSESAMQQRFEAVFNNCDLSIFKQPRAKEHLIEQFAQVSSSLSAQICSQNLEQISAGNEAEQIAQIAELLALCEEIVKEHK